MSFPSISVLGCGWLGLPLAQCLVARGHRVNGSTMTLTKIPVLQRAGIFAFCLTVDGKVSGQSVADFFKSDILVITLPFRRDFIDPCEYQKQIQSIVLESVKAACVSFIIFTSSTSVYPQNAGRVSEDDVFRPDNDRSKVLIDIENELLASPHFSATVIRLGGLYGKDRKIGAFLARQKEVSGGQSPVNLIHQDDAVGLIVEIIAQNVRGEIFNGCSDFHPIKEELYVKAARAIGLTAPQFSGKGQSSLKIVSNDKVKKVLGYQFLHPDPMDDIF